MLRWYPRAWRERYGDEFAEMLSLEFAERPRGITRTFDIARGGLIARLSRSGLVGEALSDPDQQRAAVAWTLTALVAAVAVGGAIWSQLAIGAQWEHPYSPGEAVATTLMSISVLTALLLVAAGSVVVVVSCAADAWRRRDRTLVAPVAVVVSSIGALTIGAHRFARGWPGTNGHAHDVATFAPRALASWTWAATSSVSSYWFHPGALSRFPMSELAWKSVSAALIVALGAGLVTLVRRSPATRSLSTTLSWLSRAGLVVVALFATGALWWTTHTAPAPRGHPANLFSLGAIDVAGALGLCVLTAISLTQNLRAVTPRGLSGYSSSSEGVS